MIASYAIEMAHIQYIPIMPTIGISLKFFSNSIVYQQMLKHKPIPQNNI